MPTWDINLVWSALMNPPFELFAACSLLHLSIKVVFLTVITSSRRVGELRAFMVDISYTVFHQDEVSLRLYLKLITKFPSEFHLSST